MVMINFVHFQIVSLMLREQNPSSLASAAVERSIEEKERDDAELLAIRQSESIEKRKKIQKYAGSRLKFHFLL